MTEHVLIVGGGMEIPGLIKDLAGPDGATTIFCRTEILGRIRDSKQHDRVVGLRADAPVEEWIALAAAIHSRHPFTRIGNFGERDQDRAAAMAEALGLVCHSPQTITWVHDKHAMRRRLSEVGLDDTPVAQITDSAALQDFVAAHGTPCVVKPAQGAGSCGVSVVRSLGDAEAAFERASRNFEVVPDAGVIVERFHEGPQFSVEAFSEDCDHEILAIIHKYSDPVSFVELGHVVPAELSPQQTESVHTYVRGLLTALSIRYGATHTELVLTAAGPRVIETHVRLGGDEIPYLVHDVTGVDVVDCVVRQTLGESVLAGIRRKLADPAADRRPEAIWFAAPRARGKLTALDGLPEAAARPGVVAAKPLLDVGDEVGQLDSSMSRAAFVRARGASQAEAVARAREAVASLEFVIRVPGGSSSPAEFFA
jgi:biotin carboxylase